jgi:N-acetylmuramoyl-L-alanine amidase
MMALIVGNDPGHGGSDDGTVWPPQIPGPDGAKPPPPELVERQLNLAVATALEVTPIAGLQLHLLRWRDESISLSARNDKARQYGCDVVVSIHHDSCPQFPNAHGAQSFYYEGSDRARLLAEAIAKHLPAALQPAHVVMVSPHPPAPPARDPYPRVRTVLQAYSAPTVVVEVALLSNERDRKYVRDHHSSQEIAAGIAAGLREAPEIWSST